MQKYKVYAVDLHARKAYLENVVESWDDYHTYTADIEFDVAEEYGELVFFNFQLSPVFFNEETQEWENVQGRCNWGQIQRQTMDLLADELACQPLEDYNLYEE